MSEFWRGFLSAFDLFGVLAPKLIWCKNCGHLIDQNLPSCCLNPEPED